MQHLQRSESKTSKKPRRKLNKKPVTSRGPVILIVLGLALLIFGGINFYRVRILSFSKVPKAAEVKTQNVDAPVEIIIPSINIDLPVDPGQIVDGVWQISDTHATFLDTSASPGVGGNTVIYGHNKKVIFGNLPYLSIGQKIIVKTKSGKIYNYVADQKFFVGPDRVDLVSPTNKSELTIYTCYGVFDSQRAIVKARPL